ncbi:SDR family NAD(P)-dependent oxidoreductase [Kribbella sp. NPDC051620]|uniref:SDR family NAD(P)-dependent oxidoreductase n=1 Tax=Kribbella sp. NPDC051620 TaxID=3364120 RepID=UPI0037B3D394
MTGAGQGIGRGIATALAGAGASVAVVDADGDRAEAVAAEIAGLPLTCDVREPDQVQAAVSTVVDRFGTVDILVNNAMAQTPGIPLSEVSLAEFELPFRVGPWGTFLFMKECFPYLRESQAGGRVVNLRSGSELEGRAGYGPYVAAKGAIAGLTRVAAREWGRHGITVNALSPFVLGEAAEQYFSDRPEELRELLAKTSIPRSGRAVEDVGRVVVFLAGPDASYLTGCTIPVDGGGIFFS